MAYLQKLAITAALFTGSFAPAIAQDTGQTPAPAPAQASQTPPCSSDAHRVFDFWTGTWDVTPAGQNAPTAVNVIQSEHSGCVLYENYRTKGGYTGMSMSFYDAARKTWHQTWMGQDGGPIYIEGGLNDKGEMVLSDKHITDAGRPEGTYNRVTWTPNADGTVRQHWQSTQDNGATWTTVFDGIYKRQAGAVSKN